MLYDFYCEKCNEITEVFQRMNDKHEYDCEKCGTSTERVWDVPFFVGDTCSDYYDAGLGCHIKNKEHRKAVMLEKGVTEYNPDPEMKKARDEARYVRSTAKPSEASAAVNEIYKEAGAKRKRKIIRKELSKVITDVS